MIWHIWKTDSSQEDPREWYDSDRDGLLDHRPIDLRRPGQERHCAQEHSGHLNVDGSWSGSDDNLVVGQELFSLCSFRGDKMDDGQ